MDLQPLSGAIWDNQVSEIFKPPSLVSFDGKTNPQEHMISINNQMVVVRASDLLRWYMSLPHHSVVSYQDLTKKMVHHFSVSKHCKVSTTSLFNVRQAQSESLREYSARFNEEIIKVSHPN